MITTILILLFEEKLVSDMTASLSLTFMFLKTSWHNQRLLQYKRDYLLLDAPISSISRGVSSNLLGTRITRSHDGRKFCPSGLVGRAGSGTRRVRCRLRPRGCPCVYDLSALCFGRMVTGPAPHPQGQHITPKKGLRAASAMPATCST